MAARVRKFAEMQRASVAEKTIAIEGGEAGQLVVPVAAAGCYAPGGRYPLPNPNPNPNPNANASARRSRNSSPSPSPNQVPAALLRDHDVLHGAQLGLGLGLGLRLGLGLGLGLANPIP